MSLITELHMIISTLFLFLGPSCCLFFVDLSTFLFAALFSCATFSFSDDEKTRWL